MYLSAFNFVVYLNVSSGFETILILTCTLFASLMCLKGTKVETYFTVDSGARDENSANNWHKHSCYRSPRRLHDGVPTIEASRYPLPNPPSHSYFLFNLLACQFTADSAASTTSPHICHSIARLPKRRSASVTSTVSWMLTPSEHIWSCFKNNYMALTWFRDGNKISVWKYLAQTARDFSGYKENFSYCPVSGGEETLIAANYEFLRLWKGWFKTKIILLQFIFPLLVPQRDQLAVKIYLFIFLYFFYIYY